MPYLEMVIAEALRLYPPVWMMGRRAVEDYELEGYPVRKRSVLLLSPWVAQRNPEWFPEPSRFDPERWTPEERAKRPRYSYFPFGGGPRLCVGEGFSWIEARIALAVLAQRWRFRLVPGQVVEAAPLMTLRPRSGMRMRVERR
jgi:cytochrome P450